MDTTVDSTWKMTPGSPPQVHPMRHVASMTSPVIPCPPEVTTDKSTGKILPRVSLLGQARKPMLCGSKSDIIVNTQQL